MRVRFPCATCYYLDDPWTELGEVTLRAQGIEEEGVQVATEGREAANRAEEQDKVRVGVDLGGNDIKFGATNLGADQILLKELVKRPSLTNEGPAKTIAQTLDGIAEVLSTLGRNWSAVSDVSVTVPCPCSERGTIIEATNIGTPETKRLWQVPFGDLLGSAVENVSGFSIPVFACNDANAAGQDDDFVRFGLDTHHRCSVFVTTGTGLGGCVIINGSVFFGLGQAGELGHVKPAVPARYAERFSFDPNPGCGCRGYQCCESRASLAGLLRRIEWAVSEEGAAFIEGRLRERGEKVDAKVLARLRGLALESPRRAAYEVRTHADLHQESFCRWLLEDWAIMIGALFASLAPVLHPNLFIIGGGLTEMSEPSKSWFLDRVRAVYGEVNAQSCFDSRPGNCEIAWSVSRDQGWRGAILMSMRAHQS